MCGGSEKFGILYIKRNTARGASSRAAKAKRACVRPLLTPVWVADSPARISLTLLYNCGLTHIGMQVKTHIAVGLELAIHRHNLANAV